MDLILIISISSCSEILQHKDLDGKIKTACFGSLLPQDQLNELEEQYLAHKQVKTITLKEHGSDRECFCLQLNIVELFQKHCVCLLVNIEFPQFL